MNTLPPNTSTSFNLLFDLTVDKSIDLIFTTCRQVFQLLICFAIMFLIGKLSSYLNFASTAACSNDSEHDTSNESETSDENSSDRLKEDDSKSESIVQYSLHRQMEEKKEDTIEKSTASGWNSEQITESCNQQEENQVQNKYLKAKNMNKHLKRKCMSVGPIMLTPNSQLIRCLDADDREERYTYKTAVLPCDTLIANASTDRVDVCVPPRTYNLSSL